MGVHKFQSVAEMLGPPARRPLDEDNLRLAFGLMELTFRLHPQRHPAGVRKFRSYGEAKLGKRSGF